MFKRKLTRQSYVWKSLAITALGFSVGASASSNYYSCEGLIQAKTFLNEKIPVVKYKRVKDLESREERDAGRLEQLGHWSQVHDQFQKLMAENLPGFGYSIRGPMAELEEDSVLRDEAPKRIKRFREELVAVLGRVNTAIQRLETAAARQAQKQGTSGRPTQVVEVEIGDDKDPTGMDRWEHDEHDGVFYGAGLYPDPRGLRSSLRPAGVAGYRGQAQFQRLGRGFSPVLNINNEFKATARPGRRFKNPKDLRKIEDLVVSYARRIMKIDGNDYPGVWLSVGLIADDVRKGKEQRDTTDRRTSRYYTFNVSANVLVGYKGSRGATDATWVQKDYVKFPKRFKFWEVEKGYELDESELKDVTVLPNKIAHLAARLVDDVTLGGDVGGSVRHTLVDEGIRRGPVGPSQSSIL